MIEKLGRAIQASYNEPENLLKPKEKCYEYPDIRIGSSKTDIAYESLKSASLAYSYHPIGLVSNLVQESLSAEKQRTDGSSR
jgi:hypothetical protein